MPPPSATRSAVRAVRRWTLVSSDGPVDVEVRVADDEPLSAVLTALLEMLGDAVSGLWAGSRRLADDLRLDAGELRNGAVLGLGRPGPRTPGADRSSAIQVWVTGGPCAGTVIPLSRERHVVGRGAGATVVLADPDVSRRHVDLCVDASGVTVADLGSTNGTRLDDEEVGAEPRAWTTGTALRIGASTLALTGPGPAPGPAETGTGGRKRLHPPERLVAPTGAPEIAFPPPPAAPPRRRLAWVAVAVPAVGGVALAWLMHAPTFLFLALLSPMIGVGSWLSDRLSGRRSGRRAAARHRAETAAAEERLRNAVRDDERAIAMAHPDLATLVVAARRRSPPLWERHGSDGDALVVRLGTGPAPSRVTRIGPDGARSAAPGQHLPAMVDLRAGGLGVVGPGDQARQVLAAALAQITALHDPAHASLLLITNRERLRHWSWARWLPHLEPRRVLVRPESPGTEDDEDLRRRLAALLGARRPPVDGAGASTPPWLVAVVDGRVDARVALMLRQQRDARVIVLTHAPSAAELPAAVPAVLRLGGETGDRAALSRSGADDRDGITVDRLPGGVAASFARDLAALEPSASGSTLPQQARLLDLSPVDLGVSGTTAQSGRWSRTRRALRAPVGWTADGPITLNLCRVGPHALIAGTTGSGKSELLQTLITGLALNHPPDRCSFLLVDYKGGAAFADAVALPHTVGLVTDLDGQSTSRALRSLGAELVRRERALAAHEVADIADLPDDVPLARLVIVVDEFATLAEELPAFLPDLVGIAQRGRSLGVHLVLATQRPAGVVSPEIRANCTLRLCLRTADPGDSRDVIGTPDAAYLPPDLPGRGYLRLSSGEPVAIQVARVSGTAPTASPAVARRWTWPTQVREVPPTATGPSDLAVAVDAITRRAASDRIPAPHRPWLPPLPSSMSVDELGRAVPSGVTGPSDTTVRLGLVDRPDDQRQEPFALDLHRGGALLAVGAPRSGRTTMLRTVLTEAVRALPADRLHVHVLDLRGGALAEEAAGYPHTGTTIGRGDLLRMVRLVARLAEEIGERRAGRSTHRPPILLLVDGADDLLTLLDDAAPGGSDGLLRTIRDGAAAGLTTVLTADRAVPGSRLAAVAGRRLVLPLPDRADYLLAGVAAAAVPSVRPPGRALVGEEALECQLALPGAPFRTEGGRPAAGAALRIPELPADPVLHLPRPGGAGPDPLVLPVGPGGDEGDVLAVDLRRSGGLLLAGPPGSGRTSLLDAFGAHLRAAGVPVLCVSPRGASQAGPHWVRPHDHAGIDRWLRSLSDGVGVVLADDVGAPVEVPALAGLPPWSGDHGVVLVAASGAAQLAAHFQGPVAALRRSRTGLLLCPQPGDADLLGVRLPRAPVPTRPGSGWLVTAGSAERVQAARRRDPEAGHATA